VDLGLLITIEGCGDGVATDDCKTNVRSLCFEPKSKSALYQGTTSVVPKKSQYDEGFSPCGAIKNYRNRLRKRGVARFEVLGLESDRDLIRALAKKLAQDDQEANRIRSEVMRTVCDAPPKGGILAALRRSPLVGADLIMERPAVAGRKVDL
jgi:hypothetical protein